VLVEVGAVEAGAELGVVAGIRVSVVEAAADCEGVAQSAPTSELVLVNGSGRALGPTSWMVPSWVGDGTS